ncbi:MAG: hypothetical protein M1817_005418 [Caeruleum heppii]|nr:MAG: hypothetical protein M1817_005418 [Caeruleum heppii]
MAQRKLQHAREQLRRPPTKCDVPEPGSWAATRFRHENHLKALSSVGQVAERRVQETAYYRIGAIENNRRQRELKQRDASTDGVEGDPSPEEDEMQADTPLPRSEENTMQTLGQDEAIRRIQKALERFSDTMGSGAHTTQSNRDTNGNPEQNHKDANVGRQEVSPKRRSFGTILPTAGVGPVSSRSERSDGVSNAASAATSPTEAQEEEYRSSRPASTSDSTMSAIGSRSPKTDNGSRSEYRGVIRGTQSI